MSTVGSVTSVDPDYSAALHTTAEPETAVSSESDDTIDSSASFSLYAAMEAKAFRVMCKIYPPIDLVTVTEITGTITLAGSSIELKSPPPATGLRHGSQHPGCVTWAHTHRFALAQPSGRESVFVRVRVCCVRARVRVCLCECVSWTYGNLNGSLYHMNSKLER